MDQNLLQKIIFLVHFTLASLAMSTELLTNGYMICQLVIIILAIWCLVVKDQAEPLYMLSAVMSLSIIIDAITIGVTWHYPFAGYSRDLARYGFSAAMSIILLILKPFMTIFLLNNARLKDGQSGLGIPTFGNWQNQNPQYSDNFQSSNPSHPNYGGATYQDN